MRRFWTLKEEKNLEIFWAKKNPTEVAKLLGRSINGVKVKANKLGIKKYSCSRWTSFEDKLLSENYASKLREDLLLLFPMKSWNSIWNRARRIGLKHPCHEISLKRIKLSERQVGYLAAIIDGEGNITLTPCKKSLNKYQLRVAVYNTNKKMIEYCHKITGIGTIQVVPSVKNKIKYVWNVGKRRDVYALLAIVKDDLIIKKWRGELVFEWLGEFLKLDSENSPKTRRQMEIIKEIKNPEALRVF